MELLITMAIFSVITTVVLINRQSFEGSVYLRNSAYDLALNIRDAQASGTLVRESLVSGQKKFSSQGINFLAGRQTYILFAENYLVDENGGVSGTLGYDGRDFGGNCGTSEECLKFNSLILKASINKFCGVLSGVPSNDTNTDPSGNNTGKAEECSNGATGGGSQIQSLDIIFERPNPEPKIIGTYSNGLKNTGVNSVIPARPYKSARIYLSDLGGSVMRVVEVWSTGQIQVR